MKILWFCNTPCCALEMLSNKKGASGSWLNTLSTELSFLDNIELHIAFYWHHPINEFKYNRIHYHPICTNKNKDKFNRWKKRLKETFFSIKDNMSCLINVIDEVSPDIIHIHGTEENFGLISLYVKSTPIVLSIQGFMSSINFKLFSGIPKAQMLKYESFFSKINMNGCISTDYIMKHRSEREQRILSQIKYIIGRTDFDRYCSLLCNPKRIYFKVNEIMRDEFFHFFWEKVSFSEEFTISTTISNGLYKGLEMIYLTAQLLKQKNFKFKWNIIGLSSNDKDVVLIERFTKLKSMDLNIYLLGRQNAKDTCKILQESDIYCQTSHIENSPNSTCEAMVLGMPIIASFAGGTSSIITNKETGVLIQDGDPFALGGAIMEISQSFDFAKKLGINARKYAYNNFSSKNVIAEILSVYNKILTDKI